MRLIEGCLSRHLVCGLFAGKKIVLDILKEKGSAHIDELNLKSGLNNYTVGFDILNLELQNVIVSSLGKIFNHLQLLS